MSTFIENSVAYHQARNRPEDCPYIVWLLAQTGRPCIDVRREAVLHPNWPPFSAIAGIEMTTDLEGEERQQTHLLYATTIAGLPTNISWRPVVASLVRRKRDQIAPFALALLEAWLAAGIPTE